MNLAPMYLHVRWRIQIYIVLGRNNFVCWLILIVKMSLVVLGWKKTQRLKRVRACAMK